MRSGFGGGLVVDYPHSTKAKKYFLVLYAGFSGAPMSMPKAITERDQNTGWKKIKFHKKRFRVTNQSFVSGNHENENNFVCLKFFQNLIKHFVDFHFGVELIN